MTSKYEVVQFSLVTLWRRKVSNDKESKKNVRYETMHISHIALWTSNLERSKRFYVTYFNAVAGEPYFNVAHGYESSFLRLDSGAQIEVMNKAGLMAMVKETDNQRVGLTHVAISLGSEREVDALTQRLKSDGFSVLKEPRRTGDGFYESVVLDPDGNRIELTV